MNSLDLKIESENKIQNKQIEFLLKIGFECSIFEYIEFFGLDDSIPDGLIFESLRNSDQSYLNLFYRFVDDEDNKKNHTNKFSILFDLLMMSSSS